MGTFFLETQPSGRRYVYLGRYVFEKLPRRGGGTLIWGGSFIWQWIVTIPISIAICDNQEIKDKERLRNCLYEWLNALDIFL